MGDMVKEDGDELANGDEDFESVESSVQLMFKLMAEFELEDALSKFCKIYLVSELVSISIRSTPNCLSSLAMLPTLKNEQ